ncbi:MAG: hypothetical protein AAB614_02125 [Patescibacteria group bacterium]
MITVNLLPEEYKKEYAIERSRRFFVFVFLSLYCIIIMFFVLLFGAGTFLKIETKSWVERIDAEKSTEKIKQVLSLEDDVKVINNKIKIIQRARGEYFNLADVIISISPLFGDGIYLKNLTINVDEKKINMSGFALTRNDVLGLEDFLRKNEFAREDSLIFPRSNILKSEDIDFSFNFNLK